MRRIKFEVIVTDNGVTITDRDKLFYNASTTDNEEKGNLQCDINKESFAYEMLTHECSVLAMTFKNLLYTLKENSHLSEKS